MPDEKKNYLVDLGELSKPADTLIRKVSKAIGVIYEPYQIKRVAKAEADAALIKAKAEIQIMNLQQRALHRLLVEETKKQKNIEEVLKQAIPHLEELSDAERMEDDWITNFFEKSRIVTDKEMQGLWALVLAGEANKPGSYSKRTVNYLCEFDRLDAALFTSLCGFGCVVHDFVPLIFDLNEEIYNRYGVNFDTLSHLESIGLIHFKSVGEFVIQHLQNTFIVDYYGDSLQLEVNDHAVNELRVGHVLLTNTGKELARICGSRPVDGFVEYVKRQWEAYLPETIT